MSESNSELNINHEHLLLINILNTMYNDNLRQINNLTSSNNEIRGLITRILNNPNRERNSNRNSNRNWNNYNNNNNNNRNSFFDNRRSSRSGISINNTTPLVFDYITPQLNASWTTQNVSRGQNETLNRLFQNFFEPIEVYPTPSQIEAATRIVRYSDILNPRNRSCPINLENFNDSDMVSVIRFCSHIFNTEQLNTWFRSNCRCPVCRYDIRNYNSSNTDNFNFHTTTPINETQTNNTTQSNTQSNTQTTTIQTNPSTETSETTETPVFRREK